MILLNSRYVTATVLPAYDSRHDANKITAYRSQPTTPTKTYDTYQWVDGDRIDTVALQYFGDPTQWWRIMDDNPTVLDPTTIAPGTLLRVPRV